MLLHEVLDLGRPFRREGVHNAWMYVRDSVIWWEDRWGSAFRYKIDVQDLRVDDWDVQPEAPPAPVLVTYKQFYDALNGDVSPNGPGGVAVDVRKAWTLLTKSVSP